MRIVPGAFAFSAAAKPLKPKFWLAAGSVQYLCFTAYVIGAAVKIKQAQKLSGIFIFERIGWRKLVGGLKIGF